MRLYFAGGLNELQTPHVFECGEGRNFELSLKQSKLVPRKPFDLKGTATAALPINGFVQLVKRDNSETTLVQSGDTVYLWDGASSFTSKGTVSSSSRLRDTYWSLGDYSVITDIGKATVVKKWDGTTFSTLTTGLGVNFFAKYGVVHNGRMWFFNVKTSTDTPHLMVASAFEDPTSLSISLRGGPTTGGGGSFSTGLEAFYMLSPDLKPINGAMVFYGQLLISTEGGRIFKLTGTSAATYAWSEYYAGSCALGDESMCDIGNDIVYMKAGGNIDRLITTQESGDVTTDDLSRWIPTTVKDLTACKTIYDQKNQKVFFFVADKVLVLYKTLIGGELSPWSVYTTQESFAFNTNAAKYMKMPGTQVYTVYFGDSVGRIFDMNGSGANGDAGTSTISVMRKTRYISDGEGAQKQSDGSMVGGLNLRRRILSGEIVYRRVEDPCDVAIECDWGDEYNTSSSTVALKGAPTGSQAIYFSGAGNYAAYYGGTYYYGSGGQFAKKISSQSFSPTGKGPGFFLKISLDTATDFQIDYIDFR